MYRNWVQIVANVELRQAVRIGQRWALQAVLFSDAAQFEPVDPSGAATQFETAVGVGAGVRIVPTFLADLLLRVDGSRLLAPSPAWFAQVGVQRYF